MSRVFFAQQLETIATYWRIFRQDGIALGFTSHNRDLVFEGHNHRSAPGMLPSAIRRTSGLARDSLEVQGILSHDAISSADLQAGRFDGARIVIGLVDWETFERASLFHGEIGTVSEEAGQFEAELQSAKASLDIDAVPRTSPTCRAIFCDAACQLSAVRFTHLRSVASIDQDTGTVTFTGAPPAASLLHGSLRWIDGPQAGTSMRIVNASEAGIIVDRQLDGGIASGDRALLREGCDHTLATCNSRFANSINFRGEPFLPGNDLLARYPTSSS